MNSRDRMAVLKKYECFCYQVAFFLLQNEQLAIRASIEALLDFGKNGPFYKLGDKKQRELVKNAAIRHALQINKAAHERREEGKDQLHMQAANS